MAKKIVQSGSEYELLTAKSTAMKAARIFSLAWVLLVALPVGVASFVYVDDMKKWAIGYAAGEAVGALMSQYADISDRIAEKVDVNKYVAKVKLPEIKADSLLAGVEKISAQSSAVSGQVDRLASALAKLPKIPGVKLEVPNVSQLTSAAKSLSDATAGIKREAENLNANVKSSVDSVARNLARDFNAQLRAEMDSFGRDLAKKSMKALNIKTPPVPFYWAVVFAILAFVVCLVPALLAFKVAKMFTNYLDRCPHCGKVFIARRAKQNLLKLLVKFW